MLQSTLTKRQRRIFDFIRDEIDGNGNAPTIREIADEMGFVGDVLKADLGRVNQRGIPTDIVFEQGVDVLGLNK